MHLQMVLCQGRWFYCLSYCEGRSTVRCGWAGKYEEIHHPFFQGAVQTPLSRLIYSSAYQMNMRDNCVDTCFH